MKKRLIPEEMKGKWALITGASSGMGVDYARLLAKDGMNLVVTARRKERLESLQADLTEKHGVEVEVVDLDLGRPGAGRELKERADAKGIEIELLVNNAGFGVYGLFHETDLEKTEKMLAVNIVALTELTKVYADEMIERGSGHILLVSSIGAYQPTPTYASYAAAKSYVLHFGEALHHEVKNLGVNVTVVSPGVTSTEFFQTSGQKPTIYQRLCAMKSRPVATVALKALLKGRQSVVPGTLNNVVVFLVRFVPRAIQAKLAFATMRS